MKYNYKFFHRIYPDDIDTKLSSLSKDGWRLYYLALSPGGNVYDMVFEKMVAEEPEVVNLQVDAEMVGRVMDTNTSSWGELLNVMNAKSTGDAT